MKPLVLAVVLVAAVLHAGWNALAKKGGDPLFRMALIAGGSTLWGLPVALYLGPPDRAARGGCCWARWSCTRPIMRSWCSATAMATFPPSIPSPEAPHRLLVAIGAALVAQEYLDPWGIAAIVIVSMAIGSLASTKNRRAVGYALASAVTIAIYSVMDGLGGRAAGATLIPYVAWLFVLQGLPIVIFTAIVRRSSLREHLAEHWRGGLGGGAAAIVAYGLVIWAMSQTHMSYVAALREISVVIAAIIGTHLLGERAPGRGRARRIVAAMAVAAGVVLLQVTSVIGTP